MSIENRREYVRASILLPARCQILEPEEREIVRRGEGRSLFRDRGQPSHIDEILERLPPGSADEPVFRCFQVLNNKLDFIIDHLTAEEKERRAFLKDVIEISGSGLKFTSDSPLAVGTLIKTDLIIPSSPRFRVELIAEVVRVEDIPPYPGSGKRTYAVAGTFREIDEESRDAIIRAVFDWQRKMIRMEKTRDDA
jgi:hypothetical protein